MVPGAGHGVSPGATGLMPGAQGGIAGIMRRMEWPGITAIAPAILFLAALPAKEAKAPVVAGANHAQANSYKVDSEDFMLLPGEGVELKYHMQKGAVMVYGWKANGNLRFEFHGEPDQKPSKDYYESYELNDQAGSDHAFGSFTAPKTGIHGWFWQNKTDKEIEFHLNTAGFYDSAKMFAGEAPEELPIGDPK